MYYIYHIIYIYIILYPSNILLYMPLCHLRCRLPAEFFRAKGCCLKGISAPTVIIDDLGMADPTGLTKLVGLPSGND